jgi:hypothetical protein
MAWCIAPDKEKQETSVNVLFQPGGSLGRHKAVTDNVTY